MFIDRVIRTVALIASAMIVVSSPMEAVADSVVPVNFGDINITNKMYTAEQVDELIGGGGALTTNDVCNIVTNEVVVGYGPWTCDPAEMEGVPIWLDASGGRPGKYWMIVWIGSQYEIGEEDSTCLTFNLLSNGTNFTVVATRQQYTRNALGLARLVDLPPLTNGIVSAATATNIANSATNFLTRAEAIAGYTEWTFSNVSDGIKDISQPEIIGESEPVWWCRFFYSDGYRGCSIYNPDPSATNLLFTYADEGLNLHFTATRHRITPTALSQLANDVGYTTTNDILPFAYMNGKDNERRMRSAFPITGSRWYDGAGFKFMDSYSNRPLGYDFVGSFGMTFGNKGPLLEFGPSFSLWTTEEMGYDEGDTITTNTFFSVHYSLSPDVGGEGGIKIPGAQDSTFDWTSLKYAIDPNNNVGNSYSLYDSYVSHNWSSGDVSNFHARAAFVDSAVSWTLNYIAKYGEAHYSTLSTNIVFYDTTTSNQYSGGASTFQINPTTGWVGIAIPNNGTNLYPNLNQVNKIVSDAVLNRDSETVIVLTDGTVFSTNWVGEITYDDTERWQGGSYPSIKSLTIGTAVTNIADDSLIQLWNMESVSIPSTVTSIGSSAFEGPNRLRELTIPSSVQTIGSYAFNNLNVTNIIFFGRTIDDVKGMANYPWNYSRTISTYNPASQEWVAGFINSQDPNFNTTITFADGSVSEFAWGGEINYDTMVAEGLINTYTGTWKKRPLTVVIGSGVKDIGRFAFYEGAVSNVVISSSVTNIGIGAFYSFAGPEVTIPESVERIASPTTSYPYTVFGNGVGRVSLTNVTFVGRTIDWVAAQPGYPWGVASNEFFHVWTPASKEWVAGQGYMTATYTGDVKIIGKFSQGNGVNASGYDAMAQGHSTLAGGAYSFAGGFAAITTNTYSYAWNGDSTRTTANRYGSHGNGTYAINPANGAYGFFIGESNLQEVVKGLILDTNTVTVSYDMNTNYTRGASKRDGQTVQKVFTPILPEIRRSVLRWIHGTSYFQFDMGTSTCYYSTVSNNFTIMQAVTNINLTLPQYETEMYDTLNRLFPNWDGSQPEE